MFLDFFKMKEQPFGVTPDPRFLYLGYGHREALASLYYGIESNRGFVALIAPPGLGKTTITFQLLESLQEDSRTVFLFQTKCNPKELFHYLLNGLGVDSEGMELVSMHNKLNQILSREMLAGRRFILAIDEAQNLDLEVLETIRLLSNFETSQTKLIQIMLIGQPQLAHKLASPELEQLQQRISVFARLEPFTAEDTVRYIAHRLEVCGYQGPPLFSNAAMRLIAEYSEGIPRKINGLCFSTLSLACAMERKQVDVAMVEEAIADRDIESLRPKNGSPQKPTPPSGAPVPASSQAMVSATAQPAAPAAARAATQTAGTTSHSKAPGTVFSAYPAKTGKISKTKSRLGRWVQSFAGLAACVIIGMGVLSFSPDRIDRMVQISSQVWTSIRNAVGAIRVSAAPKSAAAPETSSLSLPAADAVPAAGDLQAANSAGDALTETVVVQPGEQLGQVILRAAGDFSYDTLEAVRKLNPDVADLEHLQAGQTLRFPRAAAPAVSEHAVPGVSGASLGQNASPIGMSQR